MPGVIDLFKSFFRGLQVFETDPSHAHWYNYTPCWVYSMGMIIAGGLAFTSPILRMTYDWSEKVDKWLGISGVCAFMLLIFTVVCFFGVSPVSHYYNNHGYRKVSDAAEGQAVTIEDLKKDVNKAIKKLPRDVKTGEPTRSFVIFAKDMIARGIRRFPKPKKEKIKSLDDQLRQGNALTAEQLTTQQERNANAAEAQVIIQPQAIIQKRESVDAELPEYKQAAREFRAKRINHRRTKMLFLGLFGIIVTLILNILSFV